MASSAENRAVNLAGLVRGITLVTFPAANGAMFVPQVLTAIATSLLGGAPAHRFSAKRVLLLGLAANITSMVLLVVTAGFNTEFGVGPLVDGGISLSTIYGWTAVAGAGLALLSFAVARRQPSPQPATSPG